MANEIPDVISLGVGEPDFDTPWHIREAGIQALQSGKTFYTSNAGLQELRAAISSYTKRKTGLTYNPENQIIVTVGGSEAIDLACFASKLTPSSLYFVSVKWVVVLWTSSMEASFPDTKRDISFSVFPFTMTRKS